MLRTGLVAGLIVCMLASVCFALVETDNPLLGVLKQEEFNVVQDLGIIHVQKLGLPTMEIRDGADNSAYEVSSRLNTMLFSGTHARQLERFVRDRGGVWDGLALEADPEARFLIVRWQMPTSRDAEVYRRQFAEWRSKIAALNKTVYDTLEAWGPDPAGPQSGDVDVVDLGDGVKLEMVYIAPGTFMMGSNNGDNEEKPVHTVRISEPYWLGMYEVTQREYQQVMGENTSNFKGDNLPVERVSWNKAVEFCRKLTEQEHSTGRLLAEYEYTLPSEAQWEYAARGGDKSRRDYTYAGSDTIGEVAWYGGNSGNKTHEVGGLKANELGLYDMSGNVWEWCMDWYDDDYYERTKGAVDPVNTDAASSRVNRGGCWINGAGSCRSALRSRLAPDDTFAILGFRVCLVRRR